LFRILLPACVALAIAGCSQFGNLADDQQLQSQWLRQQQALDRFEQWNIHARAALKLEGEAYNIGIRWIREQGSFKLLLEAPFGQGVFRIDSIEGEPYRLRLPDGQEYANQTAEALLEDAIGWSLPVSGLEFWIRGMPRPGSSYTHHLDAAGRLRSLQQDQWTIDYLDYFAPGEGPILPRKIRLAGKALTLKLIIEHWQQEELDQNPAGLFPEFN
jgi:outer membrane lipoprotein LolB